MHVLPIAIADAQNRREFLTKTGLGLGAAALRAAAREQRARRRRAAALGRLPGLPHFAPRAKRVICLFHVGRPVASRSLR